MTLRRQKRMAQVPAIKTGTPAVDLANDAQRTVVNEILARPLAKVAIKVDLQWGLNKIPHGMSERPFGFLCVLDQRGAHVTAAEDGENPSPERELWLYLDGAACAKAVLWIH